MARYNFGSFTIPNLPKEVYALLKAHKETTGKSSWEIVVAALRAHLGNIQTPSPVQTVQRPSTPTPSKTLPGDKPSDLGPEYVLRRGVLTYIGGPDAAQEPPPHREDHDGADSQD